MWIVTTVLLSADGRQRRYFVEFIQFVDTRKLRAERVVLKNLENDINVRKSSNRVNELDDAGRNSICARLAASEESWCKSGSELSKKSSDYRIR